jgi:hypothetical protein
MANDHTSEDNNPIARRNFLLGAGTAVARACPRPRPQPRNSAVRRKPLPNQRTTRRF